MNRTMSAVFHGTPGVLELRTTATPQPRGGETLVRVLGCTLCGSDLHSFAGRRTVPTPTILGHEIVGEIIAFGDQAARRTVGDERLELGDRVTWAVIAHCGDCFYCRRGLTQKCLHMVKYGHEAIGPGRELVGGLADHCLLVPRTAIVRLPPHLPLEIACPASCATATIAAAWESVGTLLGRTVCILGAGLLGLTACAMASAGGAAEVVCVEVDPQRRQLASRFGATHAADPETVADLIRERTAGHGVDIALECSGASPAAETALSIVCLGGQIVLVGAVSPAAEISLSPERIVRRHLTLRGIHNYAPRHLSAAVQFLAEQHARFPFAELVTRWFPLNQVCDAFAAARSPGTIRVGVRPADSAD